MASLSSATSRLWVSASDPGLSESNIDQYNFWVNSTTMSVFMCDDNTVGSQIWTRIYSPFQANWSEATATALDFIQNKPSLSAVATSGSYNDLSSKPSIPSAQIQSDWNEANTSALDYIKNKPTLPSASSQSSATRSLNTAFQVSASRNCNVTYSVDISCSITLTTGQSGTVVLEMATNSGFTTGVQTISRSTNSNSGTLTIGLNLTQIGTAVVSGFVPAGYYVRLRTVNNTSTPTFTYQAGQEVLL